MLKKGRLLAAPAQGLTVPTSPHLSPSMILFPISPKETRQQTISDLARQSGLSEQELLAQLAQALPGIVNRLTPNGRLPTQSELGQ